MKDLVLLMLENRIRELIEQKETPETLARLSETRSLRATYLLIRAHEKRNDD